MAALFAALAILLSQCGRSEIDPIEQREPTAFSRSADGVWHWTARRRLDEAESRREALEERLSRELAALEDAPALVTPEETETLTHGSYGVLPEVYVDKSYGLAFPKPIEMPERVSWYRSLLEIEIFLDLLEDFESLMSRWEDLPPKKRLDAYGKIEGAWTLVNSRLSELAARVRYLETWIPRMSRLDAQPQVSRLFALAMDESRPEDERTQFWNTLRDLLRPHRVLKRPFLPEKLKSGTFVLPVVTDIASAPFLREVEGAIDTHWNDSPWARAARIRFRVRWIKVAPNKDFESGKVSLAEHIETFPEDKIAMTTGGDTSFVRDNVFVLSPGRITPRTLAHEFGHLLGFEDCYFRTLAGRGARGLEILEWSNPIYPDDLMCDNWEGVARSNVW